MPTLWRHRDYNLLLSEIETQPYLDLLHRLRANHPQLLSFDTWPQVIDYMHRGSSDDLRKDAILRLILSSHFEVPDPRWTTVLLVMFWPGLTSIIHQRRSYDEDSDELWNTIQWQFLEAVSRIDIGRRPDRLASKLINDTAKAVYRSYCKKWRYSRASTELTPEIDAPVPVDRGVDLAGIERRQLRRAAERKLRGWLAQGRLSKVDFHLILGTRIYGKPLRDVAREADLTYEAAKKRRQRAEMSVGQLGTANNRD